MLLMLTDWVGFGQSGRMNHYSPTLSEETAHSTVFHHLNNPAQVKAH